MIEKVIFPPNFIKAVITEDLEKFLIDNKITKESKSFDLSLLRNLYQTNKMLFLKIKLELELKGCNFIANNKSFFCSDLDYNNYEYLYTDEKNELSARFLYITGLGKIIEDLSIKKEFLNYMPFSRLLSYLKFNSSIKEMFKREGFILKTATTKNFEEMMTINEKRTIQAPATEVKEDVIFKKSEKKSYIVVPKFILNLLLNTREISPALMDYLLINNITTIIDFLNYDTLEFNNLLDRYERRNDYSLGLIKEIFKNAKKEKEKTFNYLKINKLEEFKNIFFDFSWLKENFSKNILLENYLIFNLEEYHDDDLLFRSLGLYEEEVYLLNKLNKTDIFNLFDINLMTALNSFFPTVYEPIDNLYPLTITIEKINEYFNHNYFNTVVSENKILYLNNRLMKSNYEDDIKRFFRTPEERIFVVKKREEGLTLQEISKIFNVTRERIRQLEKDFLKKTDEYIKELLDFIFLKRFFVPIYVLETFPGLLTTIKTSDLYIIDDNIGLVFKKDFYNRLVKEINDDNNLYIPQSDVILEIKEKFGINLLEHYYNFKNGSVKSNILISDISHRDVGAMFLHFRGIKGVNINNDFNEAVEFFKGHNKNLTNKRNFQAYIGNNEYSVLYGVSTFIHANSISKEQKEIVKKIIENTVISEFGTSTKSVYKKNKDILNKYSINNYQFLYGIIKLLYEDNLFAFSGRSMRFTYKKYADNLENNIYVYLLNNNYISSVAKIKKELNVSDSAIQQAKGIYKLDANTLVTKEFFQMKEVEKFKLLDIINEKINSQGFCHATDIFSELYYNSLYNDFLEKNQISKNSSRLIYTLKFFFGNDYNFNLFVNSITHKSITIPSFADLFEIILAKQTFTKEDVKEIAQKYESKSDLVLNNFLKEFTVKFAYDKYKLLVDINYDKNEVNNIIELCKKHFETEMIVFAKEIVRLLKRNNIGEYYWDKPKLLMTIMSKDPQKRWLKVNNQFYTGSFNDKEILYNNKDKKEYINIDEVIIKFVSEKTKVYITYDEIDELLKDYEITTAKVPIDILKEIFENFEESGLVRINKNEL